MDAGHMTEHLLFPLGEMVTRERTHASYGGGIQGGMLTPTGGKYIFLFSDEASGKLYGYNYHSWLDEQHDVFFYTGHGGSKGDQEFVGRNRILRDASAEGREVHLFIATGTVPGRAQKIHEYAGHFALSEDEPWRREDNVSYGDTAISMIVFRLERVGRSAASVPLRPRPIGPEPTSTASHEVVAPEANLTSDFLTGPTPGGQATRRERALEERLHVILRGDGRSPARIKIRVPESSVPLYTDTWLEDTRELIEAKGSVSRESVRHAVGQLLDYKRHIQPPPRMLTVLLPERPSSDLVDFVLSVGMGLAVIDGNEIVRITPCPGAGQAPSGTPS
jgi:hypothetical protein